MLQNNQFKLLDKVKIWEGKSPWYYVLLSKEISQKINQDFDYLKAGWGSIVVIATFKNIAWETSIFPYKKLECYFLPLKSEIRKKTKIQLNETVLITIKLKFAF